ncbi:unnamed protein product [Periconia digitata]|uniref:Uncharacterized protein n=1 Tax=Periconia digitata TaxID=1303443 RepID=A0A9W4XVZ5_9PLEO|nr:unnamed protein product [Periconia digitata]
MLQGRHVALYAVSLLTLPSISASCNTSAAPKSISAPFLSYSVPRRHGAKTL